MRKVPVFKGKVSVLRSKLSELAGPAGAETSVFKVDANDNIVQTTVTAKCPNAVSLNCNKSV